MHIVIIGAGGGIGQAFIEHFLAKPDDRVTATWHTNPPELEHKRLTLHQLDIHNEQAVETFAEELGEIDIFINAAGLLHNDSFSPEKATRNINADYFLLSMQINALPTLLFAKHLARHFRHKRPAVFATVSARVGSIEENYLGGWYSYRASKAALNQILKTLSIEWQRNLKNVCVAALHPGTTDTRLSRPFQANVPTEQLFTAKQSVDYMMQNVVEKLTPDKTGRFWSFDGETLPW